MTRVHTPNIAVLAVVLAVLTVAVAPMAVAASSGDSTSGTTIGDQLGDAGGSSDDSSDDSTDGGDSSGDGSTTDSDDSSTDDGGTSDSSGDTDADSGNDSTTSDSDDTSSDTSTDDSTDDAQEPLETVTTNVSEVTDDVALSDDVTGDLSSSTDVADVGDERTDREGTETTTVVTTNPKLDAILLETDTLDGTSVTSTTTDVTGTVDADTDTLVEATTSVLGAVDTTSPTRTQLEPTRLESVPVASQSFAAPRSNTLIIGGAAATGSTPLPPAPATGLALGAGALAAVAVTRNGAAAPTLLANLGASLGSTVTAGLAPIAGRAGVFDRLFRMLAPFRYSRYDDSDPLEHDARSDVYDVVNEAPGAYLSEVAEEADLPLSTARHHIRVLEREDLVSGAKVRGKRRFYPAYTQGIELAAALNDEATAAVIDAVARFGAASVSDLANELGRDPSTVSHHLKRLAEDDIVVRERDGRAVMNKLSAEARTALDPGRDTPASEAGEALASD